MTLIKSVLKFWTPNKNNNFLKRYASNNRIRVRFAPSPTGFLHLGGLRTAFYNHLFAKSRNGVTILRIEDTDQSRKVDAASKVLIEDLAWCGIEYDEGPYYQSERKDLYHKYVEQLLHQGDAYYCFCTNSRLSLLRKEALKMGEIPKYDNKCRNLKKEEAEARIKNGEVPCIRFKLLSITDTYNDLVYGDIKYASSNEGDLVIFKADGFPTYHLANVIDDHLMEITHVLRGVEWQMSTSKHLLLYKAFKWKPPVYAHLPLLLNEDNTKLSKRQGDIHIRSLREKGIFPNAIINFISRLGGGFNFEEKEKFSKLFTFEELIQKFDITKVKPASSKVSLTKLKEFNYLELMRVLNEEKLNFVVKATQELVRKHFEDSSEKKNLDLEDDRVKTILCIMKDRISSLHDLVSPDFQFLWVFNTLESDFTYCFKEIENFYLEVKNYSLEWNSDNIRLLVDTFFKKHNLKISFFKIIRIILTGKEKGPKIIEIMELLGKECVERRLFMALESSKQKGTIS